MKRATADAVGCVPRSARIRPGDARAARAPAMVHDRAEGVLHELSTTCRATGALPDAHASVRLASITPGGVPGASTVARAEVVTLGRLTRPLIPCL